MQTFIVLILAEENDEKLLIGAVIEIPPPLPFLAHESETE